MQTMALQRLSAPQIAALDPYLLMAVIGKRVIHPGGRRATDGPFEMMTPVGFLRDEGVAGCLRFMVRACSRLAYMQKLARLMPRMQRAVPYLG